jgi:hypothetical protein
MSYYIRKESDSRQGQDKTHPAYYLVGFSEQDDKIFDNIEWSTSNVFSQSLARIKATNKRLYVLPPWYDVDTPDSLEFLRSHIIAKKLSGNEEIPERTMQSLKI